MTLGILKINDKSKDMLMNLEMSRFISHLNEKKEDNRIFALSYMLHEKQKDKAGIDYIIHLMHVSDIALRMKDDMGCSHLSDTTVIQSTLLHDSKEDNEPKEVMKNIGMNQEQMYMEYGIHEEAIKAIDDVTRLDNETYMSFIKRVSESSKDNPLSRLLKVSDILSNTNEIRCREMLPLGNSLEKRYDKALRVLMPEKYPRQKYDDQSFSL